MLETFAILLIPAMLVTIIGKSIFNKNIDNKEFAMSKFKVGDKVRRIICGGVLTIGEIDSELNKAS